MDRIAAIHRYPAMTRKICIILALAAPSIRADDAESLFVRRVWPLFQEKCLACHGNDEKKIKADYGMRTLESAIKANGLNVVVNANDGRAGPPVSGTARALR